MRQVKIEIAKSTVFLTYIERRKGQRYCAGQFHFDPATETHPERVTQEQAISSAKAHAAAKGLEVVE